MDYLAFDLEFLYVMIRALRLNIGSISTVAIYVFLIVMGIYVAIQILSDLLQ